VGSFDAFIRHSRTQTSSGLANPELQDTKQGDTTSDVDEYTFNWQEKVFNKVCHSGF
jgi:hypothetical protein